MTPNFNTYINQIDYDAWCVFCKGTLQRYAKGEEFVAIGSIGR